MPTLVLVARAERARTFAFRLLAGAVVAATSLPAHSQSAAPATLPPGPSSSPERQPEPARTLDEVLAALAGSDLPALPLAAAFGDGPRTVAAGSTVAGPVATRGSIDVYGTVTGDVVAFRGAVVVHPGARVTGHVIAIDGDVRAESGTVAGQLLSLDSGSPGAVGPAPDRSAAQSVLLVAGWIAVLLVIGVGVLLLASDNLAAVADALERHYGNTLVAGVAGQLAFAPLLAAVIIALVLTVLGILLVPFAIVAYLIIVAGMVTLGFLATAVVIGRGWRAAPAGSALARRSTTLRAMMVGVLILMAPWLVAALLAPWPLAESIARGVALAATWVACTAGLGATLISRAGIRRAPTARVARAMASPSWQTPTPVSGVVAARRPAQTPTSAAS